MKNCLLENLAVSPLVGLAVDGDGLVPRPLVVNKLLVFWLGRVELGELVALVVGSDVESGESLLSADEESTLDDGVVGLAVYGAGTEKVLAAALETGEETTYTCQLLSQILGSRRHTNQVGGHEGESQLIVVLVVNLVEGVLLEVDVLPEPGKGDLAGLLVGVLALPVVEDECSTGQRLEGVLGLGGRCSLLLLLGLRSLGLRGGLRLLLLLLTTLLLGRNVLQCLGDELELASDSGVAGLVADGLVPTGDVGVRVTPLLVEEVLEATGDDAGDEEVGEGEALADEVGVCKEVLFKDVDSLEGGLL